MLLTNRCNTILRGTRVVVLSWHEWNDGGRWVETEIGEMPKSPDHDKGKEGGLHVMRLDGGVLQSFKYKLEESIFSGSPLHKGRFRRSVSRYRELKDQGSGFYCHHSLLLRIYYCIA